MKNKSLKTLASASLFALAVIGTGCAKIGEFGDTNQNPNGITTPIPSALQSGDKGPQVWFRHNPAR